MHIRLRYVGLALALVTFSGCSSGIYPVSGQIVYDDGKPADELQGGTITFNSDELKISASGDIEEGGSFRLSKGTFPGKYSITIEPADDEGDNTKSRKKRVIDPRYEDVNSTPLHETVEAKSNVFKLTVARPKRK